MLLDAPQRKLWTPRTRPSPRFRRRADPLRAMAIGDFRLDSSGNFLMDSLGNIFIEESCSNIRPTSLLVTTTVSMIGGCIAQSGPVFGPPPINYSVQWDAAACSLNQTFTVPIAGCCIWVCAQGPPIDTTCFGCGATANNALDFYQFDATCSFLTGTATAGSLTVWRTGTTTWNVVLAWSWLGGKSAAIVNGTATETDCMTPFSVSGGAGVAITPPVGPACIAVNPFATGTVSITPQTC